MNAVKAQVEEIIFAKLIYKLNSERTDNTMTFKKVLEVFKEYLAEDTNCEVVLTTHGYTIMQWDENSKSWYGVEYCEAPEDLQEELLSSYRMNAMGRKL